MREMVSMHGRQIYLKPDYHAAGVMSTIAHTGENFGVIPMPTDAAKIYGISLNVTGSDIRTLTAYDFDSRNSWLSDFGAQVGTPAGYATFNMGVFAVVTGAVVVTPGSIALFPCPDRSYAYTIWYLPAWSDIDVANVALALFDGIVGWEDWVVWNAVLFFCAADNDMQQCAQIATQEREKAEKRLLSGASVQRATIQRIDRRGMDRTVRR
jgi:hypothetical protein